jgi:hypothetical protein
MKTESVGTQVTKLFSVISKTERPTKLKAKYSYQITLSGITSGNIPGFTGLLQAEKVEQYEDLAWREVDITRGDHLIKDETAPGYILDFEITRKELPNTPAVYQKSQYLYIGDTLCDLNDDEIIAQNKQTNDIAEMQDRQSDFTAEFKIRKTRAMRALFELSGEVGANTLFPYQKQACKFVQDGIETISVGYIVLTKTDDEYYYVTIYSGNLNFFTAIEDLKLTDLTLASCNHNWNAAVQAASNAGDLDYIYPLLEPSDDGGINPLTDTGSRTEQYGGWIWPFIKLKAIWDEIFLNAGYIVQGDILTDSRFLKMFMPITTRSITDIDKYLYSVSWNGYANYNSTVPFGWPGANLINGDYNFQTGHFYVPYSGTYKFHIHVAEGTTYSPDANIYLHSGLSNVGTFTLLSVYYLEAEYELEYDAVAGEHLTFWVDTHYPFYAYTISIVSIDDAKIDYASDIEPHLYLPDMTQTDFIKMICNLFGLIPDTIARDRKIKFWNFNDLYKNISIARDWSAYLSETEDECELKFGDYARNNYLKYEDSDDVVEDTGKGTMQIDDETLDYEEDMVALSVSTCDENKILTDINVSRINFNEWNSDDSVYDAADDIDPRIVYVKQVTGKTFGIRDSLSGGTSYDTVSPKIACSSEVSFSQLIVNYAGLSRLLTKTNLRKAKFNLPVYEVAGLKHYIPIYLSQYRAYFYVNKINDYVPGQLCTIDLIKL